MFDCVEIQISFYRHIKGTTAEKWKKSVSSEFTFTVKASQLITHPPSSPTYRRSPFKPKDCGHFKDTEEVWDGWQATKNLAEILDAEVIVFQCPPNFHQSDNNIENMVHFFENIDWHRDKAIEFRGKWELESVKRLCTSLGLIDCVDPFKRLPLTSDKAYFRLHGAPPGKKMYNYTYTEDDLSQLAMVCRKFKEGFCMFNNITMVDDARRFKRLQNKNVI